MGHFGVSGSGLRWSRAAPRVCSSCCGRLPTIHWNVKRRKKLLKKWHALRIRALELQGQVQVQERIINEAPMVLMYQMRNVFEMSTNVLKVQKVGHRYHALFQELQRPEKETRMKIGDMWCSNSGEGPRVQGAPVTRFWDFSLAKYVEESAITQPMPFVGRTSCSICGFHQHI